MDTVDEQACFFDCQGERLLGILHVPEQRSADIGMVLVVGGPQYRIGSHRQFVLLARALAEAGIPVLRFDYRGMGDSEGTFRDFEAVSADIRAAVDTLTGQLPDVGRVVLWGLCDAASANAFYALSDGRIVAQVAANPWARTVEGEAQAFIRHYYLQRFFSRDFWRKVVKFEYDLLGSVGDFAAKLGQTRRTRPQASAKDSRPLPVRLRDAQLSYLGETLLIISGQDLTASEYLDRVAESSDWQAWFDSSAITVRRLEEADHTFSTRAWRDQVAAWTRDWIRQLP